MEIRMVKDFLFFQTNSMDDDVFRLNLEAPVQIIYASRTHSQLAQAVKEFKTTDYK